MGGQLRRIDLAGGASRDLAGVSGPWHGTWGQQDDILFLDDRGIRHVSAGGGAATSAGLGAFPAFLPDGQRFLLVDQDGIQLGRLGSTERALVLDVASAPILLPTPGGPTYLLYLRERDLMAQDFDDRAGTVRGREVMVVPGIGTVGNPALRPSIGVSASGTIAYQAGADELTGQLTWYDRAGKHLQSLPVDLFVNQPDLSPNGSLVVGTRVGALREVHIVDLDRDCAGASRSNPVTRGACAGRRTEPGSPWANVETPGSARRPRERYRQAPGCFGRPRIVVVRWTISAVTLSPRSPRVWCPSRERARPSRWGFVASGGGRLTSRRTAA